ncbi:MAG: SDR family oxidoreductase [Acidimicrobiia bacterium]|nr:SDR family oxidoreductase [Acidimicrobiia bacterium]
MEATINRSVRGFEGNVVLVTGGASGIGRSLGAAMAARGARVVLADRDGDAARDAARRLAAERHDVSARELDVTDREAFVRVVADLVDTRGRIDYLVSSAGISMGGPTHELQGPHWDRVVEVNLGGVVNGVLAAYPHMVAAGRGHIVNIASGAGLLAPPFVVPYATTKHAVVGLSLGLRPEAALHGVRVTVVCPGAVETPILDRLPPPDLPARPTPPVTARSYLAALGRSPVPVDRFAELALGGIVKGRPIVVVPARERLPWLLHRISPRLALRVTGSLAAKLQRRLLGT